MEKVNILGAGLAGLSAAILLAEKGVPSRLVSPQPSERAQSVLAEGGINAALNIMGENDTAEEHYADTMRGGVYLADPNAVRNLTENAPETVLRLRALGVPFHMENGRMIQRNFGGQKKKRTAYAKASTGKALMTALIDEARKYEAAGVIERFPHHELLKLQIRNKECKGVYLRDIWKEEALYFSGPVIAAFGGFNGLFPGRTTGTTQNTGDALAVVFSQGAELANPEFLQFHPTTVQIDGKCMLVSEAARGEGGRLYIERDGSPWYFMEEKYPELKNLMPRDVVSREMTLVSSLPECGGQVFLDLTGLSKNVWERRLPDLRKQLKHYIGIDPAKTSVPVRPGIHYFMGGLHVDEDHRTNIRGFYAAGECACQYHGANRLGGNSLLGAVYGGKKAAAAVLADRQPAEENAPAGSGLQVSSGLQVPPILQGSPMEGAYSAIPEDELRSLNVRPAVSEKLAEILMEGLSILRDENSLFHAVQKADALMEEELTEMERKRAVLGKALLLSAAERRESRGSHTRTDYPERNDGMYRKTTVASWDGNEIRIRFEDIPEAFPQGRRS